MDTLCAKQSFFPILDIGDNVSLFSGYAFSSKDFSEKGYPVIKIKNIQQGLVRVIDNCCIDKKIITEKHKKFLLSHGDILLAMTGQGSVGRVGKLILDKYENCFLNQRVGKFIVDTDKLDKDYFYYVISTKKYEKLLFNIGSGSGQPNLSPNDIKNISIPFPKLLVQKKISQILRTLDKKIELNRKTNETLEDIAKLIFKSWFVDFEPVRAKAEGHSTGLPDEICELFPDSFEDTKFGEIPKGWSKRKLSEIAFLNPESWSSKNYPEKIEYLDLSGVKNGKIQETNTYLSSDAPSRAKRILHIGDTIIGTVRPGNRSFCMIQKEGLTGSTGFAALRPKEKINAPLLYLASTTKENIQRLSHLADGGAYPAVKPEVIIETLFVLPDISIQKIFSELVSPIFCKVFENKKESNHLSNIRNTILPKLISGELKIPDAEQIIEEQCI